MEKINEQYLFRAKEILKTITSRGTEGYIVGESLRNILIGLPVKKLSIFINLDVEEFKRLFSEYKIEVINPHEINLDYFGYSFKIYFPYEDPLYDISKVQSNRHYSTALMNFLYQQDYTINAMAMGSNNIIYDCYQGKEDLNHHRLSMIGNNQKLIFKNYPLKMLVALRQVSEIGFKLDKKIISFIKRNCKYLKKVNEELIAQELISLFQGKNFKKALKLIIKTRLYKAMPLFSYELKRLYNTNTKEDFETFLAVSLVYNKNYRESLGSLIENEYQFHMLCNLAISNPKSNYDNLTLYSNGLNKCLKANAINYILQRSKRKYRIITKAYSALPIKKPCDLAYKGDDILKVYGENIMPFISDLIDEMIALVLSGELDNKKEVLEEYVTRKAKDLITKEPEKEIEVLEDKPEEEETSGGIELFEDELKVAKTESEYEEIKRRQDELDKRVRELELQGLERELSDEIEIKIKQSGLLEGQVGSYRNTVYETLRKVYYDVLINTDKYVKLKVNKDGSDES